MEGLKYRIYEERVNILDSYLVSKLDFTKALDEIKDKCPNHIIWNRSYKSLVRELAVHNFLYKLGFRKEKTKDTSLDYPQTTLTKFGFWLLGGIAKMFIK